MYFGNILLSNKNFTPANYSKGEKTIYIQLLLFIYLFVVDNIDQHSFDGANYLILNCLLQSLFKQILLLNILQLKLYIPCHSL